VRTVLYGEPDDIRVPADYDGDGRTDLAIWKPANGTWYIATSTGSQQTVQWGAPGDRPVPADYDGDGRTDRAVYRPSTRTWWITYSSDGSTHTALYGEPDDIRVPAATPN
jgi:hypothetical protein